MTHCSVDFEKLQPGDVCITRGDNDATFIGRHPDINVRSPYPIERPYVFAIGNQLILLTKDGKFYTQDISDKDIIFLKPKVIERYVNVYLQSGVNLWVGSIYETEKEAKDASSSIGAFEYIKTIRITNERE